MRLIVRGGGVPVARPIAPTTPIHSPRQFPLPSAQRESTNTLIRVFQKPPDCGAGQ